MRLLNILSLSLLLASSAATTGTKDVDIVESPQLSEDDEEEAEGAEESASEALGPQPQPQLLQKETPIPPAINSPPPQAPVEAAAPAAAAPLASSTKKDAQNAKQAAKVARQAAVVANKVAAHAIKITGHAKKSLTHALGALHDARVESAGLDQKQKETLKKAEAHLREATKAADHGQLKKIKSAKDLEREKMQAQLEVKGPKNEREHMRQEIEELRKQLKEKNIDDKDINKALDDLEAELDKKDGPINDESKAELERLRKLVDSLEANPQEAKLEKPVTGDGAVASATKEKGDAKGAEEAQDKTESETAVPVESKGLDIDTEMPYGDLEPFGREDTAQELTEASIKESDGMVDQLERAEVAEEKRAVFRALTRLRGAAITSFDGVARSQTGNIDEYNKLHQWRNTHPLHHLADEESDVSKWAFPDNAD